MFPGVKSPPHHCCCYVVFVFTSRDASVVSVRLCACAHASLHCTVCRTVSPIQPSVISVRFLCKRWIGSVSRIRLFALVWALTCLTITSHVRACVPVCMCVCCLCPSQPLCLSCCFCAGVSVLPLWPGGDGPPGPVGWRWPCCWWPPQAQAPPGRRLAATASPVCTTTRRSWRSSVGTFSPSPSSAAPRRLPRWLKTHGKRRRLKPHASASARTFVPRAATPVPRTPPTRPARRTALLERCHCAFPMPAAKQR